MDILKLLGFSLIVLILYTLLKQYKPELALLAVIAACIMILLYSLSGVLNGLFSLRELLDNAGIDNKYFAVSFKALGITLVTRFASDACHDAGSASLETKVNFAGKCAVFAISVPLLKGIVETAIGLL